MNKKFLAELESRSQKEHRQYIKELIKNPEKNLLFPNSSRFNGLKHPIVHYERHSHVYGNEKIWSQIPFAGSLIVSLFNAPKEMCLRENGFEPSDIPNLVELAKETGKIKFALQTNPLNYEGLDYLDLIFEEFNPPSLTSIDTSMWINEEIESKWNNEFFTIASKKYLNELKYNVLKSGGSEDFFYSLVDGRAATWLDMKILGLEKAINELNECMISNPEDAEKLFSTYIMITSPIFDPLTPNYNYSLSRIKHFNLGLDAKSTNIKIPEIGKMIMEKMIPNASTFYGCIDVIQKYQDNDLYKILSSFEEAVRIQNKSKIIQEKSQLEQIVSNVWSDVEKMQTQIRGVKSGLTFIFGLAGALATSKIGEVSSEPNLGILSGMGGLLSGLGFNTIESHFDFKKESISEKLVKWLKPDYIVNVYNFEKKYDLR